MTKVTIWQASSPDEFIARWDVWKCCLSSEEYSISNQLSNMLWNFGIWSMINGSVSHLKEDKEGKKLVNWWLINTLNHWFLETQMLAVRRLVEFSEIDGKRGVCSIISLLEEMIKNIEYFTRENVFKAHGLPYDYEHMFKEQEEWIHKQPPGKPFQVPESLDYSPLVDLNMMLDTLTGTTNDNRKRTDTIRVDILLQMKENITDKCDNFRKMVNKFYAHAATEQSRKEYSEKELTTNLNEFKAAQRTLCQSATFLQILIEEKTTSYLPLSPQKFFDNWDQPIFQGEDLTVIEKVWDDYKDETSEWCASYLDIFEM